MHHVTSIVCCGTAAKATGRFAVGTLPSGGRVTSGAHNTAVGAAVDLVTQPKGDEAENAVPKIVTVYSAPRTAQMTRAAGLCQIERGEETLESPFRIVLEPGAVLRFQKL